MTYRLPEIAHRDRFRRAPLQPRTVVLLALLLATLVMPVSYRAGADHAHAHTIFQGLIDAIVGHPHHHGEPEHAAPAAIPLPDHAGPDDAHIQISPPDHELDPPEQLGMSTPISAFAVIQVLGLLVTALLTGVTHRPLWKEMHRLTAHTVRVEIPPPRLSAERRFSQPSI